MMKSGRGDIAQQMNSAAARQVEKNRSILSRIILSIEFLGRLGLPLRGHRDSGDMPQPSNKSGPSSSSVAIDYSQGNFRATLQLMIACDDKILKDHFSGVAKNATYISPNSQNQLINAITVTFEQFIIKQVREATIFSILADETTDSSKTAQIPLCLRYVYEGDICERFL